MIVQYSLEAQGLTNVQTIFFSYIFAENRENISFEALC